MKQVQTEPKRRGRPPMKKRGRPTGSKNKKRRELTKEESRADHIFGLTRELMVNAAQVIASCAEMLGCYELAIKASYLGDDIIRHLEECEKPTQ